MASITKDHAERIASKLRATIVTKRKAHDLALVHERGQLVAAFGIRRGSRRDAGHGHIPDALHLNRRDTLDLANCPMSREAWIERLIEAGFVPAEEDEQKVNEA